MEEDEAEEASGGEWRVWARGGRRRGKKRRGGRRGRALAVAATGKVELQPVKLSYYHSSQPATTRVKL